MKDLGGKPKQKICFYQMLIKLLSRQRIEGFNAFDVSLVRYTHLSRKDAEKSCKRLEI